MFKKLAIAGASTALVLAAVVPAFASRHNEDHSQSGTVVVNNGRVTNNVRTTANGGKATSDVLNDVNNTTVDCGCNGNVVVLNNGRVKNNVTTRAGARSREDNHHDSHDSSSSTAESIVTNYVNTTVVGGSN